MKRNETMMWGENKAGSKQRRPPKKKKNSILNQVVRSDLLATGSDESYCTHAHSLVFAFKKVLNRKCLTVILF
jgi:hypothetical protein